MVHLQATTINTIMGRAATVSGFSQDHIEPGTFVRYLWGQAFGLHHDAGTLMYRDFDCNADITHDSNVADLVVAIPAAASSVNPPERMVTMFVYLNDHPAGTYFPFINLNVEAKAGKCLLFSNYNESLGRFDPRTSHEGVRLGNNADPKFGLNLFVSAS